MEEDLSIKLPREKKKSIEDCHKLAQSKGGKCLSTEYINNASILKWECAKERSHA